MFVAQQAARSRVVRATFVVACLIPCAWLACCAIWRRTSAHRDGVLLEWGAVIGMRLSAESIDHIRPGVLRLRGLIVHDDHGGAVVQLPLLEVETAGSELRVRLPGVSCPPAAAAVIASLGRRWLDEPARFGGNVVIDVARLDVGTQPSEGIAGRGGVRVECVGTEGGRAIRLRAEPETDEGIVVQSLAGDVVDTRRIAVRGAVTTPLPVAVVAAILDWPALAQAVGAEAALAGSIDAHVGANGWQGAFGGVLEGIDLAALTTPLPWRVTGNARLSIDECRMVAGRVASVRARLMTGAGSLEQEGLEHLVSSLGCRPGPGLRQMPRGSDIDFVRSDMAVAIDDRGLRITGVEGSGIVMSSGGVLLEPPVAGVSLDRVARALSPATPLAVPATPISGWFLSRFPFPQGPAETRR
jgi:hypothetical protein